MEELVPSDHIRRARDKLRRLKKTSSVSKYIGEFRNCILTIDDMSDGEKFDRFVQGLKQDVKLEVLKTQAICFEDATKIALRVDSALWSSSSSSRAPFVHNGTRNDPMEIGNIQRRTDEQQRRRAEDLKNNACTLCHTKYCRPWKCSNRKKVNNIGTNRINEETRPDSDLELEESDLFNSEN